MREFARMIIVLTAICCLSAVALGAVQVMTAERIARQQWLRKIRALNAVFHLYEDAPDLQVVDVASSWASDASRKVRKFYVLRNNRQVLGTAFEISAPGYGGWIDIMVGVTEADAISGIRIISHNETPGLGANIVRDSFAAGFKGRNLQETNWSLKKNGGDIDQISGATISSAAVLGAVSEGLRIYRAHKDEIMASDDGRSRGDA